MELTNTHAKIALGAGMTVLGAGFLALAFTINAAVSRFDEIPQAIADVKAVAVEAQELLADVKQTQGEMAQKWDGFVANMPAVGGQVGAAAGTAVETFGEIAGCDKPEGCEDGNVVGDVIKNIGERFRGPEAAPKP